jgi:hypothetical protein
MLRWWSTVGVTSADLAVRRADQAMLWHRDAPLADLPLAWARAENARRADVYVRPARGHSWPLVFLDDLPSPTAAAVARKYDCLVVHTSPQGGCHLWLRCSQALDEDQRRRAQRWLARRVAADPASTSGEHLGRLAGFKNWKRDGVWVNVLGCHLRGRPWPPRLDEGGGGAPSPATAVTSTTVDCSASANEWGWVCGLLDAGCDPADVHRRLADRARPRRGDDTDRYARRTVARAVAHTSRLTSPSPHSHRS